MAPSPALRCSPGREPRSDSHKRGRSLESGLLFREKEDDDDLALFNEMQSKERENFLLQSSDDLEDSFSTKFRHFSDIKLGISIPGRGETSNLLNADGEKNDYDWLLTPPDTPLFPSLDDEPPPTNIASRGRPQSKPISISRSSMMEKSYRSSRGSASPNRSSPSPRSGNNTLQSRGRPSSVPNSRPTQSLWHATPSRRPSPPPNKPITPASRSSTPTPQRLSTGSSGPVVSSGIRGTSPIKTSRGNSASPKIRAWQTNIPGFSSEAPPNLRTSLADRPASYVRGSSPASRNGRESTSKFGRQSMSPTASRSSSFHSHDQDQFSSRSKGSVTSSGDDDLDSLQSIAVGSLDRLGSKRAGSFSNNKTPIFSKHSGRMLSPSSAPKRSFDSALRQMDRKSPQNMFRPLLSGVPSTTFYVGKANSVHHSLLSRNSSIATTSKGISDQGASLAPDTEGSDHNQNDMASETEKILYPDVHEEVFSFDKIDDVNADIGLEINTKSVNILHNKTRGRKIDFGASVSEYSAHGIDTEVNEGAKTSDVRGGISDMDSSENTAICSYCSCCYEASDQAETNIKICPECCWKKALLRLTIPETTMAVYRDSSVISKSIPTEGKPLAETNQLMVVSEVHQETDVGEMRRPLGELGAEESQTLSSKLIQDHSQKSPLPSSLVEGSDQMSTNQPEVGQPEVDHNKQLNHSEDCPNLKMDLLEGTGISVLLSRSSSSKGPVVQGRTFTATTISYDNLSLARDSVNSIRSSNGHGGYSASSSIDLSSEKHAEFRVQRQLSGRKLDADCGYDKRIKSNQGLGLATEETFSGKTECGIIEEIPLVLQEMQASEHSVTDVVDGSSVGSIAVEEDKFEYHESGRVTNACSSETLSQGQAAVVQSDDNSMASLSNHGDFISHGTVEDPPNSARNVLNTETSVEASESSFDEKPDVQNTKVDELGALVTAYGSTITESEIEGANYCQTDTGVADGLSLISKSTVDDFKEHSVPNSSNDSLTASVSELNPSEHSHGIEGPTITLECQGAGHARSLTLEEATDTILFCSSIVHDLAYKAATIAMETEHSDPYEFSAPTVTILGEPNLDRKYSHSRTSGKRNLKSRKARQKVETDAKPPSDKTENDENIDEPLTSNVGPPNKVDTMKPPKLESKCNCVIM